MTTTTTDEIISLIEHADFQWAVVREMDGNYTAVVSETKTNYMGDSLTGPGTRSASTAGMALQMAFLQECGYRDKRNAALVGC